MATYTPPTVGTVRGPWLSSWKGNALPWMAYCYGPGGWVPFHAATGAKALEDARQHAASLAQSTPGATA